MSFFTGKLTKAFTAFFSILPLVFSAMAATANSAERNIQLQNEHLKFLEEEYYVNYTPCDENKITAFDIDKAISDGVKFNEVAFLGTHNSYQTTPSDEYKALFNALSDMTFGIVSTEITEFNMESLTYQLEAGVRSLEIDIETMKNDGNVSFVVSHSPFIDINSNCYDLEKALKEIKMWSDNNPGHLPVSIIIEPKQNVPEFSGMTNLSLKYTNILDNLIKEALGDTLLTPADMMGDFKSFKAMREADGWLPLGETMGKVLVLLHDTAVTDGYIKQDETIKTQSMFPMLRFADRNKTYTSFIITNQTDDALKNEAAAIDECKLIVRTRADKYPDFSEERYEKTNKCKSQIISTDYPPRIQKDGKHEFTFDGYTVKIIHNS